MEPWWRAARRFSLRLLIVCAVPVALVAAVAFWKSYDVADVGVALALAGVLIMFLGLLPLLLLPGSFRRYGPWGGTSVLAATEPLDPNDMLRQDIEDRDTTAPLTVLLLAAGVICMLAGWGLQALG
jgi:hypothetical protein